MLKNIILLISITIFCTSCGSIGVSIKLVKKEKLEVPRGVQAYIVTNETMSYVGSPEKEGEAHTRTPFDAIKFICAKDHLIVIAKKNGAEVQFNLTPIGLVQSHNASGSRPYDFIQYQMPTPFASNRYLCILFVYGKSVSTETKEELYSEAMGLYHTF